MKALCNRNGFDYHRIKPAVSWRFHCLQRKVLKKKSIGKVLSKAEFKIAPILLSTVLNFVKKWRCVALLTRCIDQTVRLNWIMKLEGLSSERLPRGKMQLWSTYKTPMAGTGFTHSWPVWQGDKNFSKRKKVPRSVSFAVFKNTFLILLPCGHSWTKLTFLGYIPNAMFCVKQTQWSMVVAAFCCECFTSAGTGWLARIEEKTNVAKDTQILEENLQPLC